MVHLLIFVNDPTALHELPVGENLTLIVFLTFIGPRKSYYKTLRSQ